MLLQVVSVFLMMGAGAVFAESDGTLMEELASGRVDWTRAEIQTAGVDQPRENTIDSSERGKIALSAAKVAAHHNMLATIKALRLDTTTTVGKLHGSDQVVMAGLQEMIKSTPISSQEFLSDGTVRVALKMGVPGGIMQLVLPPDIQQINAVRSRPFSKPGRRAQPSEEKTPQEEPYTGFVFDARGVSAAPALVPTVRDENGQEIYGKSYISREFAVQWGMCLYARNSELPEIRDRVGPKPLIIKVLKMDGAARSDLVVSKSDAARILRKSEHLSLLREGRVAIVLD